MKRPTPEQKEKMQSWTDEQNKLFSRFIQLSVYEQGLVSHFIKKWLKGEELPDTLPYDMSIEAYSLLLDTQFLIQDKIEENK